MFDQEREELDYEWGARYDDIRERFGDTGIDHGEFDDYAPEPGVELLGFNLVQVGAWLVEANRLEAKLAADRATMYDDDIPF